MKRASGSFVATLTFAAVAVAVFSSLAQGRVQPTPPDALHWSRNAAEHQLLFVQTFARAGDRLEELARRHRSGTWAVSLDEDETVLDNTPYQKIRFEQGLGFTLKSWTEWVRAAAAEPLPGAHDFLVKVRNLGGKIVIVSNRLEGEHLSATQENFRAANLAFDVMLLQAGEAQKEPRWEAFETGADGTPGTDDDIAIVMYVGDQIEDFPDLDQSLLGQQASSYSHFGDDYFILPNALYGSWQSVSQTSPGLGWVRDSAEFVAMAYQTYALARTELAPPTGPWAVVLDADETVIDNSLYQKERAGEGQGYTPESWRAWIKRKEAVPIPGVIAFLESVQDMGGKVAIVTNRPEEGRADTEANFRAEGIPFDVMLLQTLGGEKESRWRRVTAGDDGRAGTADDLTIVMWLGDNIEDFPYLDQEVRHVPVLHTMHGSVAGLVPPDVLWADDMRKALGQRYFVLPNPVYGSWLGNAWQ